MICEAPLRTPWRSEPASGSGDSDHATLLLGGSAAAGACQSVCGWMYGHVRIAAPSEFPALDAGRAIVQSARALVRTRKRHGAVLDSLAVHRAERVTEETKIALCLTPGETGTHNNRS